MTRIEFENARINAINKYKNDAEKDIIKFTGKRNNLANAKRRRDMCIKEFERIKNEGFWSKEQEYYYERLYKNDNDINSVTAF